MANGMAGFGGFLAGAALALVASRILPPLLAQTTGSLRAASGRDPLAELEDDHRHILSLLDRMERSGPDAVLERTRLLLRLKRRLTAHALAEEDVVYPLLDAQARAAEDTRHLYGEHAEMKMHLFALERMPKDDPRWAGTARSLRTLVEGHVRQEEEVDFPKLRQALDRQDAQRMAGGMQREKALLL